MKKNILIIILSFVSIGLILNLFLGWFTPSSNEQILTEYQNAKHDTITLERHITKDSTIYVKYQPHVGELAENNVTKKYFTYVRDTLAPALKIATEKITELNQIKATLEGKIKSQKTEIDHEKTKSIYYKDQYLSAVSKTDSLGESTLDYKYSLQLDVITAYKKKNFLSKDVQEIAITSPDKNLKINGVEHFKKNVQIPSKRFGLGLQAGYYYSPEKGTITPAIGVGASYNLFQF